ncbi:carboxypeptidase cpds [Trichoderma arundinaceum]|uniref:Carboxypeptidase n=1 Tax=Trichoderma arundinaceum TaxID=490622 RepID=A0A395NVA7_TRIAR|nr:carboxypeptidase cpds [Trichoderma arundinaceum]
MRLSTLLSPFLLLSCTEAVAVPPKSRFSTTDAAKFKVNGSSIPSVSFDAGESYAGSLPLGNDTSSNLFFWFWPTADPEPRDEIVIWLNGGPGCSSLGGMLKEHGAILWPNGLPAPVRNPWSWHHISNVIYIDQPIGAGFATGNVTADNEDDVARQFLAFWRNFVDTFQLHGFKVYITGESYAGMYVPYISKHMLAANDSRYFDVKGAMINDPVIGYPALTQATVNYFIQSWSNILSFNDSNYDHIANLSKVCGYDNYVDTYLSFPPRKAQPVPSKLPGSLGEGTGTISSCDAIQYFQSTALKINPGFNVYQITQGLPIPWDVLGLPATNPYIPPGEQIYFDRQDVKKAIHAPLDVDWKLCGTSNRGVFVVSDTSVPSSNGPLPYVIEKTNNVMINHGSLDSLLTTNGTLLAVQNMTWHGKMGLQSPPRQPLLIPQHENPDLRVASGQGVMGTWRHERGLTLSIVAKAGHMIPTTQPAVAFRHLQVLLGRVKDLSSADAFPTISGNTTARN